ncbi:hydroxylamine reductase [Desulfohalovibrio reitneri]|uniref:hydroxylamine reductase n=1 Tax=Desulfohalovibrio reitneri TaxID=1307759 RepID=UPI0004A772E5|nr:hydroxylamine reductase [Desulfohalovibrio reitneri]
MFCYQCEQTARGEACTKQGVCGKKGDVAAMQDLLVHVAKGLSRVALAAREQGVYEQDLGHLTARAMFATLTNVDFDPERLAELVRQVASRRDALAEKVRAKGGTVPENDAVTLQPAADVQGMVAQGEQRGIEEDPEMDADIKSLKQTVIYGVKGLCAYADHAAILGQEDEDLYRQVHQLLADTMRMDLELGAWVERAMQTGQVNLRAMELLDAGNTGTYGHPTPTEVPLGHKAGPAIVVSGHDLPDLEMLLEQTEGKGITVYTHGEMLPCHGYPKLKERFPHLWGHFGTAWQNQQKEFAELPGAVLMTTNCLMPPRDTYMDNLYTTGLVAWPGVPHIDGGVDGKKDFTPVIEKALALGGFESDEDKGKVLTGFAREAVLGVADKVIDAVKSGAVRHFFLVAGCDGAKPGRNYYTEFVEQAPEDTIILTLACGKFRFFDKQLGDIGGIPRLLDIGQCNDSYSAIKIASALAEAFDCGINDLPLSMVLSWYEQKAVAILLTLLALGIKDIRLGPSLPAFLSENVLNYLVENYGIKPITTPEEDLADLLPAA